MELEALRAGGGASTATDAKRVRNSSSSSHPFSLLGKTGPTVETSMQNAGGSSPSPPTTSVGLTQNMASNLDAGESV